MNLDIQHLVLSTNDEIVHLRDKQLSPPIRRTRFNNNIRRVEYQLARRRSKEVLEDVNIIRVRTFNMESVRNFLEKNLKYERYYENNKHIFMFEVSDKLAYIGKVIDFNLKKKVFINRFNYATGPQITLRQEVQLL